jgi:hypothetical protein
VAEVRGERAPDLGTGGCTIAAEVPRNLALAQDDRKRVEVAFLEPAQGQACGREARHTVEIGLAHGFTASGDRVPGRWAPAAPTTAAGGQPQEAP